MLALWGGLLAWEAAGYTREFLLPVRMRPDLNALLDIAAGMGEVGPSWRPRTRGQFPMCSVLGAVLPKAGLPMCCLPPRHPPPLIPAWEVSLTAQHEGGSG